MGVNADRTAVRGTFGRLARLAGWLPLAAVVPLAALVEVPTRYQYLPLVASAVVFGMPHGAVDYVALPRALRGRVDLRGVTAVSGLYLLAGGAYLLAWLLVPLPAAAFFILLTWFHWGQGDLYALRELYGAGHVDDRPQQALTVLVRGGLPMVVPLVGFPGEYRAVLATFVEPFGASVGSWWLFGTVPRLGVAVLFGGLIGLTLLRGRVRSADPGPDPGVADGREHDPGGADRAWRLDAAETLLLSVYFLLVEPVLAVGLYFCLWHSVRHILRVVLLDRRAVAALRDRRWLSPVARFGLEAAVPTLLALGLVGTLWVAVPVSVGSLAGATGLYLVAIAVLTLPHTVVVLALDREQGIWS